MFIECVSSSHLVFHFQIYKCHKIYGFERETQIVKKALKMEKKKIIPQMVQNAYHFAARLIQFSINGLSNVFNPKQ